MSNATGKQFYIKNSSYVWTLIIKIEGNFREHTKSSSNFNKAANNFVHGLVNGPFVLFCSRAITRCLLVETLCLKPARLQRLLKLFERFSDVLKIVQLGRKKTIISLIPSVFIFKENHK